MGGMQNSITAYQAGCEICGVVFCIVCLLMSTFFRKFDRKGASFLRLLLVAASLLGLCEAVAVSFDGRRSSAAFYLVPISNFLVFLLIDIMTILGLLYFRSIVTESAQGTENEKKVKELFFYTTYIGIGICALGAVLLSISQFSDIFYYFDMANSLHRLGPAFLIQLLPCVVLVVDFLCAARYLGIIDKPERITVILAVIMATVAYVMSALPDSVIGIRLTWGILAEAVAVTVFAGYISAGAQGAVKREQEIAAKDAAIKEQRIRIMQNQIRPHFIFNSLLAIKQLCIEEPEKAAEMLQHFSGFLRANLEAMTDEEPVPVMKEIECIKEYVALEMADPASRFDVRYDLEFTDFKLPLLCAEPMVENAIRHGIATKKSGGEVKISTVREGDCGVLYVEDNGLGFGSETTQQAEHRSIGIRNSKERLMLMCRGDLSIANTGNGTIVRIVVPLEKDISEE